MSAGLGGFDWIDCVDKSALVDRKRVGWPWVSAIDLASAQIIYRRFNTRQRTHLRWDQRDVRVTREPLPPVTVDLSIGIAAGTAPSTWRAYLTVCRLGSPQTHVLASPSLDLTSAYLVLFQFGCVSRQIISDFLHCLPLLSV